MRLIKTFALALSILLAVSLTACSTTTPPPGTAAYQPAEYKLGAGDQLRIVVFGENDMSKEYLVSSAGNVAFPLVGNIPVTGKSVDGLKTFLETTLANGYLNDPRVTVEVLNNRPFFILGEVEKAGKYPAEDQLTAIQAIALAGGFTYRADQREVYIRRAGQSGEETYDLGSGRPIYIGPGDTIRVGERYF